MFVPLLVLMLIILGQSQVPFVLLAAILLGLAKIVIESYKNIREGSYSLDYIAFLAMLVSLYSGEYLAGALIALMFTGGEALEAYASSKAEKSLKALGDTIPKKCLVKKGEKWVPVAIQDVSDGDRILIKRDEIIPLDGIIQSEEDALLNLSNLTGEVAPVTLKTGTFVKSGSINCGETIELVVTGDFSSSTYHKIVSLVDQANTNPARIVRLSRRANIYFTAITLLVAGIAYALTGDIVRVLAVLVIATPCPLIIAAPVAFVAGMSRSARAGIILRKPIALEGIESASIVFFDKTGTLTLGEPTLSRIELLPDAGALTETNILGLAAGIEIHSLHPLARTLVDEAKRKNITYSIATAIKEKIGKGISGIIDGKKYTLSGSKKSTEGITLSLFQEDQELARFHFEDVLKNGAVAFLNQLKKNGIETAIITGDKKENAEKIFHHASVKVYADQSPEGKYRIVEEAKKKHQRVVMVGDGLNDAPALAQADVGIVFSGTENGASIEAADVAILGQGVSKLKELFSISHRTVGIAKESIYGGIVLSGIGMVIAAFGFIPPVTGAFIQEAIDIIVILNALRALTK